MQAIKFHKVSQAQFGRDAEEKMREMINVNECKWDYDSVKLPHRSTAGSAGYDFYSPASFTLYPNESIIIPSGISCEMPKYVFLAVAPRSSTAVNYGITLLNTIAIIDADYYNNPKNEGHIMLGFRNNGDFPWNVSIGDRVCQGILLPYAITEDDDASNNRNGGIGSTGV